MFGGIVPTRVCGTPCVTIFLFGEYLLTGTAVFATATAVTLSVCVSHDLYRLLPFPVTLVEEFLSTSSSFVKLRSEPRPTCPKSFEIESVISELGRLRGGQPELSPGAPTLMTEESRFRGGGRVASRNTTVIVSLLLTTRERTFLTDDMSF